MPEALQAKIIDDEGKFRVFYTIDSSNLFLADYPGAGCCAHNNVEEGESIKFSFNAEKGVILNEEYKIGISYPKATHPEDVMIDALQGESEDFYNTAEFEELFDNSDNPPKRIEIITSEVIENDPDFNLSIRTIADGDPKEKFAIELTSQSDNFLLISSKITYPDYVIIPTIQASLQVLDDTADEENQEDKGVFNIKLEDEAGAPIDMSIYYTIEGSAINGTDYVFLRDSIFFARGEIEKTIDIEAIADDFPEDTKTIILTLLDKKGYSISSNNRGIVTIPKNDQDLIEYSVTLTALQDIITELSGSNVGTFDVSISPANTSGNDVIVNYAFIDNGKPNPATEGEGNDFTQSGNGQLIFVSGGPSTQQITVTALADPETGPEVPETITLSLVDGNQYSAAATPVAVMEILSTEVNRDRLDENALEVQVLSNTCANSNEGNVIIKNNSPFAYLATIVKEDGEEITFSLNPPKGEEENGEIEIENLPSGRHLVSFKFEDESIELIPPIFEIFIEALNGTSLKAKSIDFSSKMGYLKVSGSRKYIVYNNEKEYVFDTQGYDETIISVPLEDGVNNLKIKGEAACQGILETTLNLTELTIYPNPSQGRIIINGFLRDSKAKVFVTSLEGKNIYTETMEIKNNRLDLDLSFFPSALYIVNVATESGENIEFKLLKN